MLFLVNVLKMSTNTIMFNFIIILSAFFCLILSESRFLVTPKHQDIVEGATAEFECQTQTLHENISYTWYFNDNVIHLHNRVYLKGSNLVIKSVNKTVDAGDYVCVAESQLTGAREASPPAKLNVLWITDPVVQLINTEKQKNNLILKCYVDGSDLIEIEWFRNDKKLIKSHDVHIQNRKLIIKNIHNANDNGYYRCAARNKAGAVVSKNIFKLNNSLSNKQQMMTGTDSGKCSPQNPNLCRKKRIPIDSQQNGGVRKMDVLRVKEGLPTILNCQYTNNQNNDNLIIKWRKDGKVYRLLGANSESTIDNDITSPEGQFLRDDSARIYINRDNNSLIFQTTTSSDDGVYECELTDSDQTFTMSSNATELQIIAQLKFTPKPTARLLELGSIGKIHCKAQGTPVPLVKWELDDGKSLPDSVDDINGTLVFKNVTFEHRGNYTCVASNIQGIIKAAVAVNVVIAPRFDIAPEGTIQAIEMNQIAFHCVASGDPKPTIKWDKDLEYFQYNNTEDDRFQILQNGTLLISEVHLDDEGKYGCTIGNSAGLKREEIRLVVKAADSFANPDEINDGFVITRAVLITMSVAFTYIVFVVALMMWCRHKRRSRKLLRITDDTHKDNVDCEEGVVNGGDKHDETEPCLPGDKVANGTKKKGSAANEPHDKSDDTANSNKSKKSSTSVLEQWSLPRKSLENLILIGKGDFGDVFIGKIKQNSLLKDKIQEETLTDEQKQNGDVTKLNGGLEMKQRKQQSSEELNEIKSENDNRLILIKALNKVKDESACSEFRRQLDLFRLVSSRNVTKLYGLCREKDPHYLVLEYTDWGDLKQFLLATTASSTASIENTNINKNGVKTPALKTPQILALAHQLGRGCDAIYKARLIHKDIATRNCLISSDFRAKITLLGLSKDKYSKEYFKHRNHLIPLRWLAPEVLTEDDYTTKSDIFAFAVLVWELFTSAKQLPFDDMSNEVFFGQSSAGTLAWKVADETPKELKEILTSCWSSNPRERPSFSQLVLAIQSCLQSEYPKDPDE